MLIEQQQAFNVILDLAQMHGFTENGFAQKNHLDVHYTAQPLLVLLGWTAFPYHVCETFQSGWTL